MRSSLTAAIGYHILHLKPTIFKKKESRPSFKCLNGTESGRKGYKERREQPLDQRGMGNRQ